MLLLLLAACADEPTPHPQDVCGDGTRDEFESCDDGNRNEGDGCSSKCAMEQLVTVRWQFYATFPSDGEPCWPEVAQVEVVTESNTSTTVACAPNVTTLHLPPGDRVLARLRDANGATIAESLPMTPNTLSSVSVAFYRNAGFVRTWFATDLCPPGAVEAWLTPVAGGEPFYNATACPGSPLVSIAPAGTYDLLIKTPRLEHTITGVTVLPYNGVTDVELR